MPLTFSHATGPNRNASFSGSASASSLITKPPIGLFSHSMSQLLRSLDGYNLNQQQITMRRERTQGRLLCRSNELDLCSRSLWQGSGSLRGVVLGPLSLLPLCFLLGRQPFTKWIPQMVFQVHEEAFLFEFVVDCSSLLLFMPSLPPEGLQKVEFQVNLENRTRCRLSRAFRLQRE